MATVRLQTPSSPGRAITKVAGSKVLVGDVELEHVSDLRLVGEPGDVWKLQVTVMVDPAKLFTRAEGAPEAGLLDVTSLSSTARELVPGLPL